jgi:hypothetical protein
MLKGDTLGEPSGAPATSMDAVAVASLDRARTSGLQVRRRRELVLGLLCLVVVVTLTYWNILAGETLVATANYPAFDDRFAHLRLNPKVRFAFKNWHDLGCTWWQWEPAAKWYGRSYRSGEVPFWDPTVGGGVDGHVNVTRGQYFPPYVLLLLAGDTPLLRDMYYLLTLVASGAACFLLLYRNGFHVTSGIFMGTAWVLGGALTQNVNSLLGQTFATLPWLVLAVDWLLDRLTWRSLGVAALVVGLATYSSFLPIVISGYVLVALLAVVFAAGSMPDLSLRSLVPATRRLIAFGLAVVVAAGIAGFILVPLIAAKDENPAFGAWYIVTGRMHYTWDLLPTLLSPRLFYDVAQTFPPSQALLRKPHNFTTHFFYVGFLPVLMLGLMRLDPRPRVRRLTVFFAVSAVFLLLKLMGVPPVQWLSFLPVFKYLHFVPYFSGAFGLAIVGLAACSVEGVVREGIDRRRLAVLGAVALALCATVPLFVRQVDFNAAAPATTVMAYFLELDKTFILVVLVLGLAFLRMRGELRGTTTGAVLVVLIVLELAPLAMNRRYQRADVWSSVPAYVSFLQQDRDLFRIHSVQDLALPANTFQGLELAGIASRDTFNQTRYQKLMNTYLGSSQGNFVLPTQLLPARRVVLDLLNVKYLVTRVPSAEQRTALSAAGFDQVLVDGSFVIYRNQTVWPRAYVAHDYRVVADPGAAVALVGNATRDTVVLESRPAFAPTRTAPSPVHVASYRPDRVVLEGSSQAPGVLVVLDSFGPGWTAVVNGRPAPILPAYGAFRAIEVPAGPFTAVMRYESPGVRTGLGLTVLSLIVALAVLAARGKLPAAGIERGGATADT